MLGITAAGLTIANSHPEPLLRATSESCERIGERVAMLPAAARNLAHAFVLMHLEGTTVRPWALHGRMFAFSTVPRPGGSVRLFITLEDTAAEPHPETAEHLVRMMRASGAHD